MTEKENYFKLLRGEQPDWIPKYSFNALPGQKVPTAMVCPTLFSIDRITPGPCEDCWGVLKVPSESAGGAKLPAPGACSATTTLPCSASSRTSPTGAM